MAGSFVFPGPQLTGALHGQHGHNVPSASTSRPLVICFASSGADLNSPVASAISEVNSVMMPETVPWETPKRSAITSGCAPGASHLGFLLSGQVSFGTKDLRLLRRNFVSGR